jgi:hypothetical protein
LQLRTRDNIPSMVKLGLKNLSSQEGRKQYR